MKEIIKVKVEREVVQSVTCDMCHEQIINYGCDVSNVTISHVEGQQYQDGDDVLYETEIDLCGRCFKDKLVPWMKSQGVDVVTRNAEGDVVL